MSKRFFTREQIEQLSSNENVVRVGKTIVYSKDFKIKAVKLYNKQGLTSKEIFRQAGFDLNVIGKQKPKDCLLTWNKIYRLKGEKGLRTETRGKGGGRVKTKNLTDAEKIKWMEAEIAYLKAENDFLAKLRAKRAE
ncbi:MAG: Transposase [Candidatus Moranbacteria bacterium GW2011_GWC2_37_8]|nr:MAG: Transposase [Candidatus Moranbacteria bacterium GW2011_GWC2_37_8]